MQTKIAEKVVDNVFAVTIDLTPNFPNYPICCFKRVAFLQIQLAYLARLPATKCDASLFVSDSCNEISVGNLTQQIRWLSVSINESYVLK